MNTIDFKSFILGVVVTIIITLIFLMNGSLIHNKNGRYQFSPIHRSWVIDTQTGIVKICQYGVPFEELKLSQN